MDISFKSGLALGAQRDQRRIALIWGATAAGDRPFHLIDIAPRPDRVAARQHQPADLEFDMPGAQIDMGLTTQRAPGLAAAGDIEDEIARLNDADDSFSS